LTDSFPNLRIFKALSFLTLFPLKSERFSSTPDLPPVATFPQIFPLCNVDSLFSFLAVCRCANLFCIYSTCHFFFFLCLFLVGYCCRRPSPWSINPRQRSHLYHLVFFFFFIFPGFFFCAAPCYFEFICSFASRYGTIVLVLIRFLSGRALRRVSSLSAPRSGSLSFRDVFTF